MYRCFICLYVCTMCVPSVLGGQRGHWLSRDWVSDACGLPWECWELNLGLLEEQLLLLTPKTFLYLPLPQGFCLFVFKYFNYISVCLCEELKLVVSCPLWVLGTKLSSSARALQAFNHWAISSPLVIFLKLCLLIVYAQLCTHMCMCGMPHTCHSALVEVRGQPAGIFSIPTRCGSWDLNSGCQGWWPGSHLSSQEILFAYQMCSTDISVSLIEKWFTF